MPRMKKPQIATLDKVIITRNGDYAEITNRDQTVTAMSLKIGPEVAQMTDREILDHFNATVMAMQRSAASYRHRAEEIPPGMPQVSYFEQSDQWVPRGHVLRCVIHDEGRRPIIEIDDRDFTLEEFGAMLTTFSGWGMRIVFVPDSDLEKPPVIVVREPKD